MIRTQLSMHTHTRTILNCFIEKKKKSKGELLKSWTSFQRSLRQSHDFSKTPAQPPPSQPHIVICFRINLIHFLSLCLYQPPRGHPDSQVFPQVPDVISGDVSGRNTVSDTTSALPQHSLPSFFSPHHFSAPDLLQACLSAPPHQTVSFTKAGSFVLITDIAHNLVSCRWHIVC